MKIKLPERIDNIETLISLVKQGFTNWSSYGMVYAAYEGDYVLFNYLDMAAWKSDWNWFERASRGLVIHRQTGEVLARPFDKFFNYFERGMKPEYGSHIVTITEKMDGSLGILWRDGKQFRITTRGGFNSPQGIWATKYLSEHYDLSGLPDELTLMFEIIYPENRVVVDYGEREDLVLLAARNRHTGEYLPFFPDVSELGIKYKLSTPNVYTFNDVTRILEVCGNDLDANQEGFVVEFSDGSRWKFKGDRYLEVHRMISTLSWKNTLKAMRNNALDELKAAIPEEFADSLYEYIKDIQLVFDDLYAPTVAAFDEYKKIDPHGMMSRKDFAAWAFKNYKPYAHFLFAYYDGGSHGKVQDMIWKSIEKNAKDEPDET